MNIGRNMELEDLKKRLIDWYKLNGKPLNFEEFQKSRNPWYDTEKKEKNFIKALEDGNSEFSWILKDDREVIKSDSKAIKYGIPHHTSGNVEEAIFYHCMLNPRIAIDGVFAESMTVNEFQTIMEYLQVDYPKQDLDLYEISLEYFSINRGNKGKNRLKDEDNREPSIVGISSYINSPESNIYNELDKLKKFLELENSDKNEFKKFLETNTYYLYNYYAPLLLNVERSYKPTLVTTLHDFGKELKIESIKAKVANIELVPYTSNDAKEFDIKELDIKELDIKELDSNKVDAKYSSPYYSGLLVIRRIAKYLDEGEIKDEQPIFYFSSYSKWRKILLSVLKGELGLDEKYSQILLSFMSEEYFYGRTSNQTNIISKGNFIKDIDSYGQLSKDEKKSCLKEYRESGNYEKDYIYLAKTFNELKF